MSWKSSRWVVWALVAFAGGAFAQDDEVGYVPDRKGIEFAVNIGVYRANHQSASTFFIGDGYWELGDNTARLMSIEERLGIEVPNSPVWSQVLNSMGLIADEFRYIEYPIGMTYSPGTMMGLQTMWFMNPESAFVLHVDAMNGLKSVGGFNVVASDVDWGMGSENRRTYGIFSEEDRLQLSLGYRTAAYIVDEASWVFEAGGTLLSTRLVENYVRIENQNYQLFTGQIGNQFVGPTSSLVGTGYGAYGAIGVEVMFEEGGNLELMLRVSKDEVVMGDYRERLWHGALYLAWVIPPKLGNFVRAKF
jgi:hypothetical protein